MAWVKQEPWTGEIWQGCLNCPPVERIAPFHMIIGVGFGTATATRDDDLIFSESGGAGGHFYCQELLDLMANLEIRGIEWWGHIPDVAAIEELALHDPDHDWQIELFAPMRGRRYQRHGPGLWVLIESTGGFA